jgi:chitodextrinase
VFENGWWLAAGTKPSFSSSDSGWKQLGPSVLVTNLNEDTGALVATPAWSAEATYYGGALVKVGDLCYMSKWWTKGDPPASGGPWQTETCPASSSVPNPWKKRNVIPVNTSNATLPEILSTVKDVIKGAIDSGAAPNVDNPTWDTSKVYLTGSVVAHGGVCYKAKWWTSGNEPKPPATLKNLWDSPWEQMNGCPSGVNGAGIPGNLPTSDDSGSQDSAAKSSSGSLPPSADIDTAGKATSGAGVVASIPPVIPSDIPVSKTASASAPTVLPSTGYAFLRLVTKADWDWMFPTRSGYLAPLYEGGARNQTGGADPFSLDAFIRAVLEYNNWAQANGYKQFLNEGTLKQQAEEFLMFWAKSSRETSGTWSTASVKPGGWIETQTIGSETMTVWKGGLYWVEEVGYTTNSETGTSTAINYVDAGSTEFPPSIGRSYYGRGVIQLSWNYNYGAFSYWMYDNGLFKTAKDAAGKCVIDKRNKLLDFPNLVADCGDLSVLSGIWFWMTPQGTKPSSHDVLYGDITNISASTNSVGLPQTNTGYVPKVASGSTTDEEVFAYRMGTIINIVNGGLECNKASTWHNGPPQRVSYYDTYAAYFNAKYSIEAVRLKGVSNVWTSSITASSPLNLQSATCYNQKSYYGW